MDENEIRQKMSKYRFYHIIELGENLKTREIPFTYPHSKWC